MNNTTGWDGTDRFGDLFRSLRSERAFEREMFMRWLMGDPFTLILSGGIGVGKSYFFENLLPEGFRHLLSVDKNDKDFLLRGLTTNKRISGENVIIIPGKMDWDLYNSVDKFQLFAQMKIKKN